MSPFVEALKRNYTAGRILQAKIDTLKTDGKITQEEYNYIIGSEQ